MEKRNVLKNQKGFTLIEIIAVLVILGILAAVAVPKFIDLQNQAREKALSGAVAAIKSQVMMDFASNLLASDGDTTFVVTTTGSDYGDFVGGYETKADGLATVTITDGPDWFDKVPSASLSFSAFSYK